MTEHTAPSAMIQPPIEYPDATVCQARIVNGGVAW